MNCQRRFWSPGKLLVVHATKLSATGSTHLLLSPMGLVNIRKQCHTLVLFFIMRKFNLHLGILKYLPWKFTSYLLEVQLFLKTGFSSSIFDFTTWKYCTQQTKMCFRIKLFINILVSCVTIISITNQIKCEKKIWYNMNCHKNSVNLGSFRGIKSHRLKITNKHFYGWVIFHWGLPRCVKNLLANEGDRSLILGSGRSPGKGNGYPLQYSCLGNPMDRGARQARVHWVTKSQAQLSTCISPIPQQFHF